MLPTPFSSSGPVTLVGESEAVRVLRETATRVANGHAKVLVTGETGVGKEIVARSIHAQSPRQARQFVPVNCAAISDGILESELFGHVKGSFTGAHRDKIGCLQLAHHGTVFLDELGEMSLRMQALLLRFLESGEIHPVGSHGVSTSLDVRIVAATNRNLTGLVSSRQFREDLMYRVKVVHLHVPPLRERLEDLPLLVEQMLNRLDRPMRFTEGAINHMMRYHWPGNVRELQNVIEQICWISESDVIDTAELRRIEQFAGQPVDPGRSRQVASQLYDALRDGQLTFWGDVYTRFLRRDMTRDDLKELVRHGLERSGGNYRAVLPLFGIAAKDYKRFMNFLAAHECAPDFRTFRSPREAASGSRP